MATPRFICPFTLTLSTPPPTALAASLPTSPEAEEVRGVRCIGPQCHAWVVPSDGAPDDGNCLPFVLGPRATIHVAELATRAFNAGQQEAQEGLAASGGGN
jgi:hypothetical protein